MHMCNSCISNVYTGSLYYTEVVVEPQNMEMKTVLNVLNCVASVLSLHFCFPDMFNIAVLLLKVYF